MRQRILQVTLLLKQEFKLKLGGLKLSILHILEAVALFLFSLMTVDRRNVNILHWVSNC